MPAEAGVGVAVEVLDAALAGTARPTRMFGSSARLSTARAAPRLDRPARVEVPVKRPRGASPAGRGAHEIGDDDQVAVQREDAAAVLDWAVAVVRAVEVVEGRRSSASACHALLATCDQWNGPFGTDCGRSSSVSVLCSADERRRSRSAGSDRVAAGSRIDQERHAARRERSATARRRARGRRSDSRAARRR